MCRQDGGRQEGWILDNFITLPAKINSIENYNEGKLQGEVTYFYPSETKQGRDNGTKE